MNGDGSTLVWEHSNVWAAGKLIATYSQDNTGTQTQASLLHFYLDDPLGTRRVQTDYAGVVEKTCQSLPFGDGETCLPTPSEHLFTGKERDAESGNDYFGARYYASSMGRFLSPDPLLNSGHPSNPQSWNRYAYAKNSPLGRIDPTGLYDIKCGQGDTACQAYHTRFNEGADKARELLKGMDPKSDKAKALSKALDALGKDGDGNGVTVSFGATKTGGAMETNGMHITVDFAGQDAQQKAWRDAGWDVNTTVDDAAGETHEATHLEQNKEKRPLTESEAYTNESWISEAGHSNNTDGVWNESWANGPDRETLRQQGIKDASKRSEDAVKAALQKEKKDQ